MNITITLGWWLVPAVLTFLAYAAAFWGSLPDDRCFGFSAIGAGAVALVYYAAATIVTLLVWLVYAVALHVWA